jgi:hypothetical protein
MFLLNDKPLSPDNAFEHEGIQYPANWLRLSTLEEKQAIGITEVSDPESYDDRFYWGVDNPKDLEQLKTNWSAQVRDTTNKLLASSDWMVIRKAERNINIPEDIVTYRAAVLTECDRLLTAIVACSDVPSLVTVVMAQNWPALG